MPAAPSRFTGATKMTDNNSRGENLQAKDSKRCAIYARYSSDLQRPSSIEDQVRKCTQECQRHKGGTITEERVVADQEGSGRSRVGGDGLSSLEEAVDETPRPFACVLIDETSPLARHLDDVLEMARVVE